MKNAIRILIVFCVMLPMVMLVLQSLGRWRYPEFLPRFGFEDITNYITSDIILNALLNSIGLAILVTVLALFVGFFPAKYLATTEFRGKRILEMIIIVPALTPGIAVVFGMMGSFVKLGIYNTIAALVLGQLTFALPYMIMSLLPVFANYESGMEDQSTVLGVDGFSTFLFVTLPAVKQGIAVGCMYTFIVSWSMYLFTSMYSPSGFSTLVTELFPLIGGYVVSAQNVAVLAIMYTLPALIFILLSARILKADENQSENPR